MYLHGIIPPVLLREIPLDFCCTVRQSREKNPQSLQIAFRRAYRALAFHGDALTFVMAEMEMPTQGVIAASRMTVDDYSFRVIAYYSGDNDQIRLRIDGLWGWACLRPEWACRLAY